MKLSFILVLAVVVLIAVIVFWYKHKLKKKYGKRIISVTVSYVDDRVVFNRNGVITISKRFNKPDFTHLNDFLKTEFDLWFRGYKDYNQFKYHVQTGQDANTWLSLDDRSIMHLTVRFKIDYKSF